MTEHEERRKAIASRLRLSREMAGLTQGQVAKSLDWHRPTVSEIEAGRRRVSAEELTTLAEVYGGERLLDRGRRGRGFKPRCRPGEAGGKGVGQAARRRPRPSPPACPSAPRLERRHRMNDRRAIARQAIAAALRTRLSVGYGLDHAICVYDLAEKLGVEVRFLEPSQHGGDVFVCFLSYHHPLLVAPTWPTGIYLCPRAWSPQPERRSGDRRAR